MKHITNTNITTNADAIGDLIFNRTISEKYSSSMMDFKVKMTDFNELLETLNEDYSVIKEDYKISKFTEVIHIREKDDNFIILGAVKDTSFVFDMYTASDEINFFLFKKIKKFLEVSNETEVIFTTAGVNAKGAYYNTKIMNSESFKNVSTEYYPYIDINEMFSQFFKFNESILCLGGIPGCGKSRMATLLMDYMIENENLLQPDQFDYNVLYTKSTDVLVSDEFWSKLDASIYDLIIFDDLDYLLGTRGSVTTQDDKDKNKFISNLLSYTDGVQDTSTKFIITTNQPIKEIDKAILRKGRMFDILELRTLTLSEAKHIWCSYNLDIEKYPEFLETEEVLQANLGSEIEKTIKDGPDRRNYITEKGISKLDEYNKMKRVGL